ncbi:uncharacterized protein FFMR_15705 [Fusarium fujikuroi]|nr:uncharacterized protein FFMR_15705 [Fusarium fujikuroi]
MPDLNTLRYFIN